MGDSKFDQHNRAQVVETTLDLLDAVEGGEPISQRGLAVRLGVALGLTNALLKRCVRKGVLKVREAPARRYAYYLTPAGFAEKSRLTAEYLSSSLTFFRRAREEYGEAISYCANRGWHRIVLCGSGDLAEIALLAMNEQGITPVAVIVPGDNREVLFETPVVRSLEEATELGPVDALIVTESRNPQRTFDALAAAYPLYPIVTPPLLRVRRPDDAAD